MKQPQYDKHLNIRQVSVLRVLQRGGYLNEGPSKKWNLYSASGSLLRTVIGDNVASLSDYTVLRGASIRINKSGRDYIARLDTSKESA